MSGLYGTRKMYKDEVNRRFPNNPLRGVRWYQDEQGAYILVDVHEE